MNKSTKKKIFTSIEKDDSETLFSILETDPKAIEITGEHNRNVRDKTPLMYALQCRKLELASILLDHGASPTAKMAGGPKSSVLDLCANFAHYDPSSFSQWVDLVVRLLEKGANPSTALWPALHAFGSIVKNPSIIKLLLEYGADPDIQLGDSGNTIRELLEVNKHLYPDEIHELFTQK